jgi:hypothetical protein
VQYLRDLLAVVANSRRNPGEISLQSLCNRCEIASQSLRNCGAIALKLLQKRFAITAKVLHDRLTIAIAHSGITAHLRRNLLAIFSRSLHNRSEFACNRGALHRCTIAAKAVCNRFAIASKSRAITAELLRNSGAISLQSFRNRCKIAPKVRAIAAKYLCNRFAIDSKSFQNHSGITAQ